MVYIKKLVMHGFKSFPRKTEMPFDKNINVILGPNGSGKSNLSDALCFVLGRLSIKSMRAAKARNLIFLGTKAAGPAKEAMVEIIFDNSDKVFSLKTPEISIKRIVKRSGQSTYKVNNETKTRQEVLSVLAQAGIDSNGFNLILQGEIHNFARMHSEERRKIIEEVSGISIYESRKEKAMKELYKTEERLKEVAAILRERTSYLNNLERERQQALRFKKLEKDVKICKASIINQKLKAKEKEAEKINSDIEEKNKQISKIKKIIVEINGEIEKNNSKIDEINSNIQKSTGFEQEKLNQEIANLRAEMAGINVRIENYENKLSQVLSQKKELEESVKDEEKEINELKTEPVRNSKKEKDAESKKKELEILEEERKKFYMAKSELKSVRQIIEDKKSLLDNYSSESNLILNQVENITKELFDKNTNQEKLNALRKSISEKSEKIEILKIKESQIQKSSDEKSYEVKNQDTLKEKISKLDICPVCKSQVTEKHLKEVNETADNLIKALKKEIEEDNKKIEEIIKEKEVLSKEIKELWEKARNYEKDLTRISSIEEKIIQLKRVEEKIKSLKTEIENLENKRRNLERNIDGNINLEKKYETLQIEVQEISLRTKENLNEEITFKQKELERVKISLKQILREESDLNEDLETNQKEKEEKEMILEEKKFKESELSKKFEKLIAEREILQKSTRDSEIRISENQNKIHNNEQDINHLSIDKSRVKAEIENYQTDILDYPGVQIINSNKELLESKLEKTKELLSKIGTVNLLSLEVYDSIKKEYDTVREKAEIIEKEKSDILRIIHDIDLKKKKTFMQTFEALNEKFSRNFSSLSSKGIVSLEIEDKKDPFSAGVNIIVKTGHGKYFDVTSLSGGEQTLVALSLIFAIQELKPYAFYVLDEIDAALDKRNSERLAELLKKYMQNGQYIVITHNDEIITNASTLYGISMHEGISKITSMRL
ncbi:MAG: chromosome segregation SMC family protein [Candidatus Pacearchaeota archaeon]